MHRLEGGTREEGRYGIKGGNACEAMQGEMEGRKCERYAERECESDAGRGRGGREGCESWREGRGEAERQVLEAGLVAGGRKSLCSARD